MATIKGIKAGTTTITASYGSLSSTVNLTVAQLDVKNATIGALSNQTYNGSAFKLKPTVTMTVGGVSTTLVENTDYTLSWNSNSDGTTCTATGTITVTVKGQGNYKGTNSTRTYQITSASFTVSEPDQSYVYNGSAQGAAISVSGLKGGQTATIKYGTTSGNYNLTSAPQITNVLDSKTIYWQVTAPNHATQTGDYKLTITKATPGVPVLTKGTGYYNGSTTYYAKAANASKCVTPNTLAQPAGIIYYGASKGSTSNSITAGNAANLVSMGRKDVGTTTIYAFFRPTDTDNYNDSAQTASTTVVVSKGTMTITATGYSGTYDAASHTAVTFTAKNQSNATITPTYTYATTEGGTYSSTVPTVTNYTAGTTIYWKATLSGYNDASGNVTAKVAKATPGIPILTNGSGVYDGSTTYYATAKNNTKCVTPSSLAQPAGKIYYGSSVGSQTYSITAGSTAANLASMGRSGVGTTTICAYFVPTDTTNYNSSATTASATVTVSSGTLTVTAVPYNSTYDGGSHNAITSISAVNQKGTAVNPSYTYSKDGTNYSATMPTVQNANGSGQTIYWRATLSGYNDASGNVTAIVRKATPTFALQSDTREYHNTAYITARASVVGKIYWGTSTSSMTEETPVTTASTSSFNTTVTSRSQSVGTTTIYAYFTPNDTSNYNSVGSSSEYSQSASAKITASTDNDISISVSSKLSYNGANQTIATKTGGEGCASFTLGYSTTSGGTVTWGTENATTLSVAGPGTYYIHYKVKPDTNHSKTIDDKQIDATSVISNGTLTITITGYSGTYNGNAHNIVATGPTVKNQEGKAVTGVTYTYSDSENGTYSSSLTRANATGTASNEKATVTYWVKAVKSGYTTAKTSFKVYIARANNPLTVTSPTTTSSSRHKIYNTSGYNTVQISTSGAQGAVSYTSSSTSYATVSNSGLVTYVAAGTPNITVTAAGNGNYKSGTVTVYIQTIVDTVTTYGDLTGTIAISQHTNFPASGVTLTKSNISTYFSYSTPCAQTITWASGNKTQGTIRYAWSDSNVSIPSLGTTETSTTTSRAINFTVTATGEGSKTASKSVTSGKQEANPVTSIVLKVGGSTGSKTINFGDSATTEVTATYKSGSTGVITPTSITSSDTTVATVS